MPHGIRVYRPGFVHMRGAPEAYAIASAPFRDPPDWAGVAHYVVPDGTSRLQPMEVWSEVILLARSFPVRVRRQRGLRGWRKQFGTASR